jgi:hypothetical protein
MPRKFIKHLAGKVVQQVVVTNDDAVHEVEIRFTDKTACHIEFGMRMELELVEIRDWKTGNGRLVKRFV